MPPQTELIINGNFENGSTGWTGTDLEIGHTENTYLGNGGTSRVSEVDGAAGQTTVMEQTFTVTNPTATALTLDVALRTSANPWAGSEGFTVEILDNIGTVIANATVLPTSNTMQPFSLPVTFPAAGDYTLRFTEISSPAETNGRGAVIDNVSLMVCFAGGTRIRVPGGERPVEALQIGDLVETAEGPKPLRWIGRRRVTRAEQIEDVRFRPVLIRAGALGRGLPSRDLLVSRQHRMLAASPVAERMFDSGAVLIAAHLLTGLPGVGIAPPVEDLRYFHLMFDAHELVWANGAPSESLYLGQEALKALAPAARAELRHLFPGLFSGSGAPVAPARPIPAGRRQRQFIARLMKNGRDLLEQAA